MFHNSLGDDGLNRHISHIWERLWGTLLELEGPGNNANFAIAARFKLFDFFYGYENEFALNRKKMQVGFIKPT